MNVATIQRRIVDFAYKLDLRILFFNPFCRPLPELYGHHLRHVAAEGVYSLRAPVEQYIRHLMPYRWDGGKVANMPMLVVHAVVELDRLVPIITARKGAEAIIAGRLGRTFYIRY